MLVFKASSLNQLNTLWTCGPNLLCYLEASKVQGGSREECYKNIGTFDNIIFYTCGQMLALARRKNINRNQTWWEKKEISPRQENLEIMPRKPQNRKSVPIQWPEVTSVL